MVSNNFRGELPVFCLFPAHLLSFFLSRLGKKIGGIGVFTWRGKTSGKIAVTLVAVLNDDTIKPFYRDVKKKLAERAADRRARRLASVKCSSAQDPGGFSQVHCRRK
jgi:hypothetical protein